MTVDPWPRIMVEPAVGCWPTDALVDTIGIPEATEDGTEEQDAMDDESDEDDDDDEPEVTEDADDELEAEEHDGEDGRLTAATPLPPPPPPLAAPPALTFPTEPEPEIPVPFLGRRVRLIEEGRPEARNGISGGP